MGSDTLEDPLCSPDVNAKHLCEDAAVKLAAVKLDQVTHEESSERGIGLYLYVLAATSFL